jgi:putative DNA methylase
MTHRKKLIEVALPLEAINAASAREKSIRHGHPSTLHLWWARRPLAAARAVIFTSLVDDPDSLEAPEAFVEACKTLPKGPNATGEDTPRMRLFDFIERLVTWEATTDEAILEQARELIRLSTDGNPPPLLDPFAGGGSIPLEAQRLGLEAHASDLNPVAVMINKAQIEIPPRFANQPPVNPRDREQMDSSTGWKGAAGLAADVRYYGEWMRERAWEKIGHLYPEHNGETVIAWLWARTVESPNPAVNAHVPLMRTFQLSKKKGKAFWARPVVNSDNKSVQFEIVAGQSPKESDGTISRGGGTCLITGVPITYEYLREQGQSGKIGTQLIAVVTEGHRQRNYHPVTEEHTRIASSAVPDWEPSFEMATHSQYMGPPRYGIHSFNLLFTPRQNASLATFCALLRDVEQQIIEDAKSDVRGDSLLQLQDGGNGIRAYSEAVAVYLAFAIDRSADFWSSSAIWANQPKNELVMHTFGRQVIPMVWDYAEANPFSNSGGNWTNNLSYVAKAVEKLAPNEITGMVRQESAETVDYPIGTVISTDPPYYDNVPYADLSDYFYVWLRKSLKPVYPTVFSTLLVPKQSELVADHERFGGRDQANNHFENGLRNVFHNARSRVSSSFPLTVYYAFKQAEITNKEEVSSTGWETMLESLISSGFTIDGTWPMRTERSGRMRATGSNALASSIILVCRPRSESAPRIARREFVTLLRQELPSALAEMQSGNIAPVDLAQASIGCCP